MNGFLTLKDLGSQVACAPLTMQAGTAGGTGDNTELTSDGIDRLAAGGTGYMSAVLVIAYLTTVAAAQTLRATVKVAQSDDGTNWGSSTTLENAVTLETGAVTGKKAVHELSVDLSGYKRHVRFLVTMDLSAANTDTFLYGAALVMGSPDKLPV